MPVRTLPPAAMSRFAELSQSPSEASSDDSIFDSDLETSDGEEFHGIPTWQTAANIAKNIIGEGILSLPAGLAAGRELRESLQGSRALEFGSFKFSLHCFLLWSGQKAPGFSPAFSLPSSSTLSWCTRFGL